VNPSLAVDNQSDLRLDSKALKAVIGAVRHQMASWQEVREADVGEDAFADLQNDIAYFEILLHTLEHTYTERYGVAPE
jgi:hypothetical protein